MKNINHSSFKKFVIFYFLSPFLYGAERSGLTPIDGAKTCLEVSWVIFNSNHDQNTCVRLYRGIDPSAGEQHGRSLRNEALIYRKITSYAPHAQKTVMEHHSNRESGSSSKDNKKTSKEVGNFSQYTSWTYSKSNAQFFAAERSGVVVSALFTHEELAMSPNIYAEKEVLVLGEVFNVDVYLMTANYRHGAENLLRVDENTKYKNLLRNKKKKTRKQSATTS